MSLPFFFFFPQLYKLSMTSFLWYGILLWSISVSCPNCVPYPNFLCTLSLLTGRVGRGAVTSLTLCKHCSVIMKISLCYQHKLTLSQPKAACCLMRMAPQQRAKKTSGFSFYNEKKIRDQTQHLFSKPNQTNTLPHSTCFLMASTFKNQKPEIRSARENKPTKHSYFPSAQYSYRARHANLDKPVLNTLCSSLLARHTKSKTKQNN